MYARVIIDIAHANVDRLFTYEIPEGIAVQPGHRVLVPFGAGNRKTEGFVLAISSETDVDRLALKPILRTMEPYPALTEEQIAQYESADCDTTITLSSDVDGTKKFVLLDLGRLGRAIMTGAQAGYTATFSKEENVFVCLTVQGPGCFPPAAAGSRRALS